MRRDQIRFANTTDANVAEKDKKDWEAFKAMRADLEKQRAAIQREIDDVRQSLNETKKNKKETLGQLNLIQRRLKLRLQI